MFDVKVNTRLLHTAKVKQKALPGFEGAQMNSSGAKPFMLVLGAFDFLNVCLLLSETEDPKRLQQCLGSLLEPKVKQTTPLKCGGDLMITDLKRMGVNDEDSAWRISTINTSYSLCDTYPAHFAVPRSFSDSTLKHAAAFRIKQRLPILSYIHPQNKAVLVRSGQPMVGLRRNRSVQDEHLLEAIRHAAAEPSHSVHPQLLIIDARPTVNALVNTMTGAGFELLDHYPDCSRSFVNIENIHTIRAAFLRMLGEIYNPSGNNGLALAEAMERAGWLGHLKKILDATRTIVQSIDTEGTSVLVHCSDGWDRTAQLISLAKVCLDPYYRSCKGLLTLIHNDWLAIGHKFSDRCGHDLPINSLPIKIALNDDYMRQDQTTATISDFFAHHLRFGNQGQDFHEFCPIFPQFLDCLGQMISQNPEAFEYDHQVLHRIYLEVFSNETGLFGANSERERQACPTQDASSINGCKIWNAWHLLSAAQQDKKSELITMTGTRVILPDIDNIKALPEIYVRPSFRLE